MTKAKIGFFNQNANAENFVQAGEKSYRFLEKFSYSNYTHFYLCELKFL